MSDSEFRRVLVSQIYVNSLKHHLHLNDARCFITGRVRGHSKHHNTWQNTSTVLSLSAAFRISGTIAVSGFSCFWKYCVVRLYASKVLSGSAANRGDGTEIVNANFLFSQFIFLACMTNN